MEEMPFNKLFDPNSKMGLRIGLNYKQLKMMAFYVKHRLLISIANNYILVLALILSINAIMKVNRATKFVQFFYIAIVVFNAFLFLCVRYKLQRRFKPANVFGHVGIKQEDFDIEKEKSVNIETRIEDMQAAIDKSQPLIQQLYKSDMKIYATIITTQVLLIFMSRLCNFEVDGQYGFYICLMAYSLYEIWVRNVMYEVKIKIVKK